jgi:hypothetical protein
VADLAALRRKYRLLLPTLDERMRRIVVATEAHALGRRGVALLHRATGMAPGTIRRVSLPPSLVQPPT